jgi:acetyl esterase/lipase
VPSKVDRHRVRDNSAPARIECPKRAPQARIYYAEDSQNSKRCKRLPAYAQRYLAGADPRHPYASPALRAASGLPPLLIQVGSDEILRDDSVRMAEKFRGAGGEVELEEWPRMPHGLHHYARIIAEGRQAIERIGVFVQIRLN